MGPSRVSWLRPAATRRIHRGRVAATPWLRRGYFAARTFRGRDAAAATWIFRRDRRTPQVGFIPQLAVFPVEYLDADLCSFVFQVTGTRIVCVREGGALDDLTQYRRT